MRSLIIIEVEHGETTDPLQDFINDLNLPQDADYFGNGELIIKDYTTRVDVPACFVLESEPDEDEGITCDECKAIDSHFLHCSLHPMNII